MFIANPIYDTVFKYLMEDNESARLLISGIIGQEIEVLSMLPQENILELDTKNLTVFRMDFSARIKSPEGDKTVIIEVQKAKLAKDILRFRRYLGQQYQKKENTFQKKINNREVHIGLPIINIYLLGYSLENVKVPVIKVNRQYIDLTTGKEIIEREDFIESLSHDSYVIQIPQLHKKHQTELEQWLSVFDQDFRTENDYFLDINEVNYPEKFKPLIKRLLKAASEPDMRKKMEAEDEILEELQDLERVIAEKDKTIEEKDKTIEENAKILKEKDKIIAELKKKLNQ